MAYLSYRHGRHDLPLPPPEEGWTPVADVDPDDADDVLVEGDAVPTGRDEPGQSGESAQPPTEPGELGELGEPPGSVADGPGELVAGARARLRAVLDAYPELPADQA